MPFDRTRYFDAIRPAPFGGSMTQEQVDGQEAILTRWEAYCEPQDHRWLAYELATTYHECAGRMVPIEEYGKGKGYPYGVPDPVTGQTYDGRGLVQLTWKDNYQKMADICGCDLVYSPDLALTDDATTTPPYIASTIMFEGMCRGTFTGKKLSQYFNDTKDDPVNARAIINADVSTNGQLIAGYHKSFLAALETAYVAPAPAPAPEPPAPPATERLTLTLTVDVPIGASVTVASDPPGRVQVAGGEAARPA